MNHLDLFLIEKIFDQEKLQHFYQRGDVTVHVLYMNNLILFKV